jgi:hypothetical protein
MSKSLFYALVMACVVHDVTAFGPTFCGGCLSTSTQNIEIQEGHIWCNSCTTSGHYDAYYDTKFRSLNSDKYSFQVGVSPDKDDYCHSDFEKHQWMSSQVYVYENSFVHEPTGYIRGVGGKYESFVQTQQFACIKPGIGDTCQIEVTYQRYSCDCYICWLSDTANSTILSLQAES